MQLEQYIAVCPIPLTVCLAPMYCGSFPLGDMSCWKLEVFAKLCNLCPDGYKLCLSDLGSSGPLRSHRRVRAPSLLVHAGDAGLHELDTDATKPANMKGMRMKETGEQIARSWL